MMKFTSDQIKAGMTTPIIKQLINPSNNTVQDAPTSPTQGLETKSPVLLHDTFNNVEYL